MVTHGSPQGLPVGAVIGVLAVQGAFAAHCDVLRQLGFVPKEVRAAADFSGLQGLVLPGGESSTQLLLLERLGMWSALATFIDAGRPILATCAGLILLARDVRNPAQRSLGAFDVAVSRNGWGRQRHSCEATADDHGAPLIMIRAPKITEVGERVEVLWRWQGAPVLIRQGACFGAIFHPELTHDLTVHRLAFGGAPVTSASFPPSEI